MSSSQGRESCVVVRWTQQNHLLPLVEICISGMGPMNARKQYNERGKQQERFPRTRFNSGSLVVQLCCFAPGPLRSCRPNVRFRKQGHAMCCAYLIFSYSLEKVANQWKTDPLAPLPGLGPQKQNQLPRTLTRFRAPGPRNRGLPEKTWSCFLLVPPRNHP